MKNVTFEGQQVGFPDDATDEEIQTALSKYFPKPLPQTSAVGAFLRQGAQGLFPAAASGAGAVLGAGAGIEAGPPGMLIGGMAGAVALGGLAGGVQTEALKRIYPEIEELNQADIQQHPWLSAAGRLAAMAPSFEVNPLQSVRGIKALGPVFKGTSTLAQRQAAAATATQLGAQVGLGAGQTLLEGRKPTAGELAESAAAGLIFGQGRGPLAIEPRTPGVTDAVSKRGTTPVPLEGTSRNRQKVGARVPGAEEPAVPQEEAPLFSPQRKVFISRVEGGGWLVTDGNIALTEEYPNVKEAEAARNKIFEDHINNRPLDPPAPSNKKKAAAAKKEEGPDLGLEGTEGEAPTEPEVAVQKTRVVNAEGSFWVTNEDGTQPISPPFKTIEEAQEFQRKMGVTPKNQQKSTVQEHANAIHEQAAVQAAKQMGFDEATIEDVDPQDPNVPFHIRNGNALAWVDKTGAMRIHRGELHGFIERMRGRGMPEETIGRVLTESLASEELIHKYTSDADALGYWNNLTALEKSIVERGYTGMRGGQEHYGRSDTEMGHEAIRRMIQRLHDIAPMETLEFAGKEHWTQKLLNWLEGLIYKIRRNLGRTAASKLQQEYLDRTLRNLKKVRETLPAEGETPFALSRKKRVERDKERLAAMRAAQQPQAERTGPLVDVPKEQLVARHNELRAAKDFGSEFNAISDELVARGLGSRAGAFQRVAPIGQSRGKAELTTESFAREATSRGIVGQEAAPGASAGELGALPKLTARDVDRKMRSLIGERPDLPAVGEKTPENPTGAVPLQEEKPGAKFQGGVTRKIAANPWEELARWGKANTDATEEQLRDQWRGHYVPVVEHATGARLEELRAALNLESVLGARRVVDAPGKVSTREGDLPGFEVPVEAERQTHLGRRSSPEQRAQEYRRAVQSAIMRKLWEQSQPKPEVLSRKEIALDDIDWYNKQTTQGAWREIRPAEADNPQALRDILSDEARTSGDDVSVTKRLVALRDRQSGKVVLVSAYPHGRTGIMVYEPTGATGVQGKTHVELAKLLARWRPVASALLKEPVKGFWKEFPDAKGFADYIGKEAGKLAMQYQPGEMAGMAKRARVSLEANPEADASIRDTWLAHEGWGDVPEGMLEQFEAEGTPGIRGEGGMVTGEHAQTGRLGMGIGRGEIESSKDIPITPNEVMSVMDYATDEAKTGGIGSPYEMRAIMDRLVTLAENHQLKARDWTVIAAIQKAAYRMMEKNPTTIHTLKGGAEAALQKFYELIQSTESRQDYIHQALGAFSKPPAETMAAGGITRPEGVQPARPGETGPVFRTPSTGAPELAEPGSLPPSRGAKSETDIARESLPTRPGTSPAEVIPTTESQVGGRRFKPPEQRPFGAPEPAKMPFEELATDEHERIPAPARETSDLELEQQVQEKPQTAETRKALSEYVTPEEEQRRKIWEAARGTKGVFHETPLALVRGKSQANDEVKAAFAKLGTVLNRREARADIARYRDAAQGASVQYAMNAANAIRVQSKDPVVRGAARAVIGAYVKEPKYLKNAQGNWFLNRNFGQTHLDPKKFDNFIRQAEVGIDKGERLMQSNDWRDRRVGRQWKAAGEKLKAEAQFAKEHYNDPDVESTVEATKRELAEEVAFENANGMTVSEKENYVPGMYEPEFFDDQGVMFSELRILGKNFRQRKRFDNVYDAIANGPYIPASYDVADLAQSRIYGGRSVINKRAFIDQTMKMLDPETGATIGVKAKPIITEDAEGNLHTTGYATPSPTRELVSTGLTTPPVAILRGYQSIMKNMLAESQVPLMPGGRLALSGSSMLKHGALLILDSFHIMRLGQYATALGGKNWHDPKFGFHGGWSALNFRAEDLPRAVEQGLVSKRAADWALTPINVWVGRRSATMTRQELAHQFIKNGLNATKIVDALYRDAVKSIPLIGESWSKIISPVNRFIFDKMTPGMMVQAAVSNFERLNKANPNVPVKNLMRDIVTDTNVFFGNLGRQGLFKNPTLRDMLQTVLLAPSWLEGLVQKDARFLSRVSGLSYAMGRRGEVPYMGTLGRGMARGLAAYLIGTQIFNLISRGHLTFQNEEKEHKLDAWLPSPFESEGGVWMSPASVFAEVIHDINRLGFSKPTVYDALAQVGANKLGPIGRLAHVLLTGKTSSGERITSTGGVIGEAAKQLAPVPITLSKPLAVAAHAAFPGTFAPPRRGDLQRQILASAAGIKVEPGQTDQQRIMTMAQDYVRQNNLKAEPYDLTPTDEASYTKLRGAIRNGDMGGASNLLEKLRQNHSDKQIIAAMKIWARHPFTGSKSHEQLFLSSLSDKELDTYFNAMMSKQQDLQAFEEFFVNH